MTLTEGQRQLLAEVFEHVEWAGSVGVDHNAACPVCHAMYGWGDFESEHEPDCKLKKGKELLKALMG